MTSWSRQLALIGLIGLIVGVTLGQMSVAILCLAWLLWMLWEWVQFSICSERELGRFQLERWINGRSDATGVLWAGRTLDIRVRICCKSNRVFPDRIFRDVVPENLEIICDKFFVLASEADWTLGIRFQDCRRDLPQQSNCDSDASA